LDGTITRKRIEMTTQSNIVSRQALVGLLPDQANLPSEDFTISYDYSVDTCGVVYIRTGDGSCKVMRGSDGLPITGRVLRRILEEYISLPCATGLKISVPAKGLLTFSLEGFLKGPSELKQVNEGN
jgi:hypothetical protein